MASLLNFTEKIVPQRPPRPPRSKSLSIGFEVTEEKYESYSVRNKKAASNAASITRYDVTGEERIAEEDEWSHAAEDRDDDACKIGGLPTDNSVIGEDCSREDIAPSVYCSSSTATPQTSNLTSKGDAVCRTNNEVPNHSTVPSLSSKETRSSRSSDFLKPTSSMHYIGTMRSESENKTEKYMRKMSFCQASDERLGTKGEPMPVKKTTPTFSSEIITPASTTSFRNYTPKRTEADRKSPLANARKQPFLSESSHSVGDTSLAQTHSSAPAKISSAAFFSPTRESMSNNLADCRNPEEHTSLPVINGKIQRKPEECIKQITALERTNSGISSVTPATAYMDYLLDDEGSSKGESRSSCFKSSGTSLDLSGADRVNISAADKEAAVEAAKLLDSGEPFDLVIKSLVGRLEEISSSQASLSNDDAAEVTSEDKQAREDLCSNDAIRVTSNTSTNASKEEITYTNQESQIYPMIKTAPGENSSKPSVEATDTADALNPEPDQSPSQFWTNLSVSAACSVIETGGSSYVAQSAANAVLFFASQSNQESIDTLRSVASQASRSVLASGGDNDCAASVAVTILKAATLNAFASISEEEDIKCRSRDSPPPRLHRSSFSVVKSVASNASENGRYGVENNSSDSNTLEDSTQSKLQSSSVDGEEQDERYVALQAASKALLKAKNVLGNNGLESSKYDTTPTRLSNSAEKHLLELSQQKKSCQNIKKDSAEMKGGGDGAERLRKNDCILFANKEEELEHRIAALEADSIWNAKTLQSELDPKVIAASHEQEAIKAGDERNSIIDTWKGLMCKAKSTITKTPKKLPAAGEGSKKLVIDEGQARKTETAQQTQPSTQDMATGVKSKEKGQNVDDVNTEFCDGNKREQVETSLAAVSNTMVERHRDGASEKTVYKFEHTQCSAAIPGRESTGSTEFSVEALAQARNERESNPKRVASVAQQESSDAKAKNESESDPQNEANVAEKLEIISRLLEDLEAKAKVLGESATKTMDANIGDLKDHLAVLYAKIGPQLAPKVLNNKCNENDDDSTDKKRAKAVGGSTNTTMDWSIANLKDKVAALYTTLGQRLAPGDLIDSNDRSVVTQNSLAHQLSNDSKQCDTDSLSTKNQYKCHHVFRARDCNGFYGRKESSTDLEQNGGTAENGKNLRQIVSNQFDDYSAYSTSYRAGYCNGVFSGDGIVDEELLEALDELALGDISLSVDTNEAEDRSMLSFCSFEDENRRYSSGPVTRPSFTVTNIHSQGAVIIETADEIEMFLTQQLQTLENKASLLDTSDEKEVRRNPWKGLIRKKKTTRKQFKKRASMETKASVDVPNPDEMDTEKADPNEEIKINDNPEEKAKVTATASIRKKRGGMNKVRFFLSKKSK